MRLLFCLKLRVGSLRTLKWKLLLVKKTDAANLLDYNFFCFVLVLVPDDGIGAEEDGRDRPIYP